MDGESDHRLSFTKLLPWPRTMDVAQPKGFSPGNREQAQHGDTSDPPLSHASGTKRRER